MPIRPSPRSPSRHALEPRLTVALVVAIAVATQIALAFGFSTSALAAGEDGRRCGPTSRQPTIVKIHADWCGSCRATADVWERVKTEFGDEARIVRFDVTDRLAHDAAKAEASALGLDEFFQEYRRRTGVIAFLAAGADSPTTFLAGERDFAKYRAALDATVKAGIETGVEAELGGASDCAAQ